MRWGFRRRAPHAPPRAELDDEIAAWIRAGQRPFRDFAVGWLVPVVFERYARLLHPAKAGGGVAAWDGPSGHAAADVAGANVAAGDAAVRWDEIARWSGRTMHRLVQWEYLVAPRGQVAWPPPFVVPPPHGGLPPSELETLTRLLRRHTMSPGRSFVGIWEGYGGWAEAPETTAWPRLSLDQRAYLVAEGSIAADGRLVWPRPAGPPFIDPPTLIWPADRAWFVASDTDLDSTYLGGSAALIEALLAEPGLEAWPAEPTDDISVAADTVNAG